MKKMLKKDFEWMSYSGSSGEGVIIGEELYGKLTLSKQWDVGTIKKILQGYGWDIDIDSVDPNSQKLEDYEKVMDSCRRVKPKFSVENGEIGLVSEDESLPSYSYYSQRTRSTCVFPSEPRPTTYEICDYGKFRTARCGFGHDGRKFKNLQSCAELAEKGEFTKGDCQMLKQNPNDEKAQCCCKYASEVSAAAAKALESKNGE